MTLNGAIKQLHDIRNSDAMPVYFKPAIAEVINVLLCDVRENIRGEWIDYSDEGYVECPFCHSATNCEGNKDELHYCFSCGAELR